MVKEAIERVSCDLGNTPTVCRASYVHPKVLDAFASGTLHDIWSTTPPRRARLTLAERRTVAVLKSRRRRAVDPEEVAARAS
jgi:DNA topoisomerase-1